MREQTPVVLIIDDEDGGRFAKAQILRRAGFEVIEASTGQAGLGTAVQRHPDVVVLDVNLPDISGLEVARRLKAHAGGVLTVPILQISSTAVTTADRVHGLEAGADVYLTEPIAAEILVATVRALLRAHRAERALAAAVVREREARDAAEEASRLKDEFIATLSHELRTPLNALMGWIYQLRHSALDERTRIRALDSLERNARVQAQLINDLLDISRISKGKLHLQMQLLDVRTVIRDAVDSVRDVVARKHLALSVTATDECWVVGDFARLQQVVTNLLTNAVQFTPDHGHIEVDLRAANGSAQITVADSGAGIEQEFLRHVFDQFKQGEGGLARKHGGLGLGLAVVRQLVELHGGSVQVASAGLGKGATFTLLLPREMKPASRGDAALALTGTRVLVADVAAYDLASILEASGAKVTPADTVEKASEALASQQYEVIAGNLLPPDLDLGHICSVAAIEPFVNPGDLVRRVMQAAQHRAQARTSPR